MMRSAESGTGLEFAPDEGRVRGEASGPRWFKLTLLASTSAISLGVHDAFAATALPASATTLVSTPVTIDLAPDITFAYGPFITLSTPAHGTASIAGTVVTYTPAAGFTGVDTFTYGLDDGIPASSTVTVSVGGLPTQDSSIYGVVGSLQQTALFSALSQITNFNRHLDDLRDVLRHQKSLGLSINGQTATNDLRLASIASMVLPSTRRPSPGSSVQSASAIETAEAGTGGETPIELPDRIGIFVNGNLALGDIDRNGIHPSASPRTTSISFGVDYRLMANTIIGLGGGYTGNTTDIGGGSKTSSDAFNVTVYGTTRPIDPVYIDAQASYGHVNFHSTRNTTLFGFAYGDPDANQAWGSLTGGYEMEAGPYTFGPYVRLDGSHSVIDGFTETGSTFNVTYNRQTVDSLISSLGFRGDRAISTAYGILSPHVRVEYQHEFIGTSGANVGFANGAASGFRINAYPISRNYFTLGGGVSFLTVDAISAFIDYDALLGYTHQSNHSITVGASARF